MICKYIYIYIHLPKIRRQWIPKMDMFQLSISLIGSSEAQVAHTV